MGDELILPSIKLPGPDLLPPAIELPRPILEVPTAELPNYKPIVVPPSNLQAPPGVESEGEEEKTTQPEVRKLDIPIINFEMPVPSGEVVVTAVTTAVVAVATTTVAQSFFEPIKKKVQKFLQKKVDAWKKNRQKKKKKKKVKDSSAN
tara:strand:+ start:2138 stop:2581 length:444 start_codon:yes stop_codon:yes gene_type:complete